MGGSVPISSDILVIGGGINGCGIAADAAGRGLHVTLCEQGDLGQGTSSASSKLIHGGLRYLGYFRFGLVRKSLSEREVLLCSAPHVIHAKRFLFPHHRDLRPAWMIRLGLFIYDHLGGRKILPGTKTIRLRGGIGKDLKDTFKIAFEYSDCIVNDSRLVVLNAMAARDAGAQILCRHKVLSARRDGSTWQVRVQDLQTGKHRSIRAKVIVNAAGPWIGCFAQHDDGLEYSGPLESQRDDTAKLRLVKGSHIVVPRIFDHDRAYILQSRDGRIVFAIPFEKDFTLVGTTDVDFSENLDEVTVSDEEVEYLRDCVGEYFNSSILPEDVLWKFAGVRPLFDDGTSAAQAATRDYVLKLDRGTGNDAPLLSVIGGKITTYRVLAEQVLEMLRFAFPSMKTNWTAAQKLPGGAMAPESLEDVIINTQRARPQLDEDYLARLVRTYGTYAQRVIGDAESVDSLGRHFGADLYEKEVRYLMDNEWAMTAQDVLWRRTKLGLRLDKAEMDELDSWMQERATYKGTNTMMSNQSRQGLAPDGANLDMMGER